jgi:hypothetical protein
MTTISGLKYVRASAFAAAAIAVAAAAVLVTAAAAGYNIGFRPSTSAPAVTTASVSQSTGAAAVCDDFLKHFAGDLKSSPQAVNAAFEQAAGQTLTDEVANGTLTQKQADAIRKQLTSQAPCALVASAANAKTPPPGAAAKLAPYTQELLKAAASALGITPAELQADFGKGMSLSAIAAAQNPPVTEAQFRARLITNLTPLLDQAVKDGSLTAAQEQAIITHLQTGAIPFWNTAPKMGA